MNICSTPEFTYTIAETHSQPHFKFKLQALEPMYMAMIELEASLRVGPLDVTHKISPLSWFYFTMLVMARKTGSLPRLIWDNSCIGGFKLALFVYPWSSLYYLLTEGDKSSPLEDQGRHVVVVNHVVQPISAHKQTLRLYSPRHFHRTTPEYHTSNHLPLLCSRLRLSAGAIPPDQRTAHSGSSNTLHLSVTMVCDPGEFYSVQWMIISVICAASTVPLYKAGHGDVSLVSVAEWREILLSWRLVVAWIYTHRSME
ncbi:oligosaccharide translocation protein rft1 [Moniliophthora roreri]|nr:oligosaccharide translocation protein rft1 [Moniliophthora roreri]